MTRKSYQEGGSWRRQSGIIGLLVLFGCFIVVSSTELDLPSDNDLKRAKQGATGGIGLYADEGDGGSGNSTGGGGSARQSDSTSYDKCSSGDCCFQYTWVGYRETIPEAVNATCEFYRKEMRDDTIACYDPMVFTKNIDGSDVVGTPPDLAKLNATAAKNYNWPIYCVKSKSKSCITYTHYSGNEMVNQTRFCGRVTNQNRNQRVTSGCYKQKVGGGSVREVCICDKNCLSSSSNFRPASILTWTTIIAVATFTFGV